MREVYALAPADFLRSIEASRDTLGRAHMRLIDIVAKVQELSGGAPYAVIGGLAQILWARKTHTDDLDVALAAGDLTAFRDEPFNAAILATARPVAELGAIRFITPELLLVTHLLRPGPLAALAAVELILARREHSGLDLDAVRAWAERLGKGERLARTLERADAFALE